MTVDIIRGDARNLPLADNSVDVVVTSPPYFALRSYQDGGEHYEGQIGSEPTPAEFLDALIAVTAECVRVLKPSGSIFVNLGDKYNSGSGSGPQSGLAGGVATTRGNGRGSPVIPRSTLPAKTLMGIPWRYALRCIDDLGLILRAEIIWSKPNGLPESVRDRVRRSHEQWFHFTVSPRYFSAVDEIREAHAGEFLSDGVTRNPRHKYGGVMPDEAGGKSSTSTPDRWSAATGLNPLGKLPGSVWTVPTQPLTVPAHLGVDHFAAFPTEWPKRLISGWCPAEVCTVCGEGRRPVRNGGWHYQSPGNQHAERALAKALALGITAEEIGTAGKKSLGPDNRSDGGSSYTDNARSLGVRLGGILYANQLMALVKRQQDGYACACPDTSAPATPGVVLDPFGGTGTTALVAHALGRHGISVDLSADYCRLAEWRTSDRGELARVLGVPKPPTQLPGQVDLFGEEAS